MGLGNRYFLPGFHFGCMRVCGFLLCLEFVNFRFQILLLMRYSCSFFLLSYCIAGLDCLHRSSGVARGGRGGGAPSEI